jgi:hypothetical protein
MSTTARPRPENRGGARAVVLLVVALGLAIAGWWLLLRAEPAPAPPPPTKGGGPMSEAERIAYVKEHVTLEAFEVAPDTKPDSDEPVPGLLRVKGEIANRGPRPVSKVVVAVYPRDAAGEVVAAYVEDVLKERSSLEPGAQERFEFTIPDRSTPAGDFARELR